ncbi:MAG TPA: xyloglucanase, partial [Polyangiaceae bacterium]|nr:xyloglucanase [Polyangiaceae bacterium]
YAAGTGSVLVSVDGGASFGARAALATGGSSRIRSAPGREGDVWIALYGGGLARSIDSGASFGSSPVVDYCAAIGFGAPRSEGDYPAVYIWGSVEGGPRGIYRSDDAGETFQRINDDRHQYGGPGNGQFVLGDANVYGRVFLSTAGRGLVMGELADLQP